MGLLSFFKGVGEKVFKNEEKAPVIVPAIIHKKYQFMLKKNLNMAEILAILH